LRLSLKASVKMARSSLLSRAIAAIGSLMTIGQWQRSFCCHTKPPKGAGSKRARAQSLKGGVA
jgi:hypothetical protein